MPAMIHTTLSGNPLDRAAYKRLDADWLAAARKSPKAVIAVFSKGRPLVKDNAVSFLTSRALEMVGADDEPGVFLGLDGEDAYFGLELDPQASEALLSLGQFVDLRGALALLPEDQTAILGEARGLLNWHATHRFCARCGKPSTIADGGWKRVCPDCKAEHFPRTDPVVIMVAIRGERALLGRQAMFPPNSYSALAGFMEPGETIEEAVAREVMEEAGVEIGAVRYVASQPWPFPSSLMIGCVAEALSDTITLNDSELEDARWFTREEVVPALGRPMGQGPLSLPPRFAIAHQILRCFLDGA